MLFVDTHCHLNFHSLQDDIEAVLQRASDHGICKIMVPGTDLETSLQAVRLSENYSNVYASVGIHPNDANGWDSASLNELKKLALHPKVLAIGEIGLDFYHQHSDPDLQESVLLSQLELAANLQKPVILHCRQAMTKLWPIMDKWQQNVSFDQKEHPGVFHSFDSDLIIANEIIKSNFLIGVSGPITYKNAKNKQEVISAIPLDKLLLETDSPFLPPHPHRGQTNEPANIPIIARKIADLKQCPIEEVARITTNNAEILFQWKG